MRQITIFSVTACGLAAIFTTPAFSHVSLETGEAPVGAYKAVLRVPHGCDGRPTTRVRVDLPEGFIDGKPMLKPGWTVEIENGDYARTYKLYGRDVASGARAVTWSGGSLPDDFFDDFVVLGTLSGVAAGQMLAFNTVQSCGATDVAWKEVAKDGQNPHSLAHPAPVLKIAAGAARDEHAGHDMTGMGQDMAEMSYDMTEAVNSTPVSAGDLTISGGWAKAMLPGQPTGGAYLTVTNNGKDADKLVGASSPSAGKVELHTMEMSNDVMVMRPVEGGLDIPAGGTVELKPGAYHLMFMKVTAPFEEGGTVPVTLEFEKAGKVEVELPVAPANGKSDMKMQMNKG